jgi:hypothetical protein
MRVRTFLRRAVVPNILPAITCTAVLLALRSFASHSVFGVFLAAALGCITYVVTYLLTGATSGEKRRGLAFVTRPLPRRWRTELVDAGPAPHEDTAS